MLAKSLLRIADDVVEHGMCAGPHYRAAREMLLLVAAPRLGAGEFEIREDETSAQFAIRMAAELNNTALRNQGPPGAGKTYTGARMICELVRNGARVGVTA